MYTNYIFDIIFNKFNFKRKSFTEFSFETKPYVNQELLLFKYWNIFLYWQYIIQIHLDL